MEEGGRRNVGDKSSTRTCQNREERRGAFCRVGKAKGGNTRGITLLFNIKKGGDGKFEGGNRGRGGKGPKGRVE